MKDKLYTYLSQFASENRLSVFEKIIAHRTRYLTVVLEDIYQPHNASAVLRTCDCFGIQDVHIIENQNEYNVNPDVALGASKWLNLYKYNDKENNTLATIDHLRAKGYRIIATSPHKNDVLLPLFDLEKGPAALFFGTEMHGLSDKMLSQADEYLKVPMSGFTESFNISVSAAIILYDLTVRLRNSGINWELSEAEKTDIKLSWLKESIKKADMLEKRFLKTISNQ